MSARAVHLVIDARHVGRTGLLAAEVVLGKSVLGHLLDLAVEHVPPSEAGRRARARDEHERLRELAGGSSRTASCSSTGRRGRMPRSCGPIASTTRAGCGAACGAGRSPESAVLWRLDRPESLSTADRGADAAVDLSAAGQVLGVSPGAAAGGAALPDLDPPNALTLACRDLDALGGGDWSPPVPTAGSAGSAVALSLALALVLDTADGRLARLQGTSSAFGRWLDQVLDELADLALHAAIAWAAFCRDGRPLWLVLGIIYASGKYLFLVQSLLGDELEAGEAARVASARPRLGQRIGRRRGSSTGSPGSFG